MKDKATLHTIYKLLAVLLGIYILKTALPNLNGFLFSTVSLILVILLTIPFALRLATRQFTRLQLFKDGGWFKYLFNGVFIRLFCAVIFAIPCAMALLFTLAQAGSIFWLLLLAGAPCSLLVHKWLGGLKREYVYPADQLKPVFATSWIMIVTLTLLSIITDLLWGTQTIALPNFKSNFLNEMVVLLDIQKTASDALSSSLTEQKNIPFNLAGYSVIILSYFSSFLAIFLLLELVQIPIVELKKALQPIASFDKKNAPLGGFSLTLIIACTIIIIIHVWLPRFGYFEEGLKERPISAVAPRIKKTIQQEPEKLPEVIIEISVEMINGKPHKQGTIQKTEPLASRITTVYDDTSFHHQYEQTVNIAFDTMVKNVDIFLDEYYSLSSDYVRLAKMLSGNLETYLQNQLQEALTQSTDKTDIAQLVTDENDKRTTFDKERLTAIQELRKLLEDNKIEEKDNERFKVIATQDYPFLIDINFLPEAPKLRWGIAGGTGLGAAAVAGAVSKKIAAGGAFKIAASLLGKKALAVATGTGIGATVGSVVPFFGTITGGVIGGLTGALATDWGLLKANEVINRETFKKQIVDQINEQRTQVLQQFNK